MSKCKASIIASMMAFGVLSASAGYGNWNFDMGSDQFAELMLSSQADNVLQRMRLIDHRRYYKQIFLNGAALYQYHRFSPESSKPDDSSSATFNLGFNVMFDRHWLGYSQLSIDEHWPKKEVSSTFNSTDTPLNLNQSYIAYQKPSWNLYALAGVAPVSYGLFEQDLYGERGLLGTLFQVKNAPQVALTYHDGVNFITATGFQVVEGKTGKELHNRYALSMGFREVLMGVLVQVGLSYLSKKSFEIANHTNAGKAYGGHFNFGIDFGGYDVDFINEYHQSPAEGRGKIKARRNGIELSGAMLGCERFAISIAQDKAENQGASLSSRAVSMNCDANHALVLGIEYSQFTGNLDIDELKPGKHINVQMALKF